MKQAGGPVSPLLSMLTGTHTHAHTHNKQHTGYYHTRLRLHFSSRLALSSASLSSWLLPYFLSHVIPPCSDPFSHPFPPVSLSWQLCCRMFSLCLPSTCLLTLVPSPVLSPVLSRPLPPSLPPSLVLSRPLSRPFSSSPVLCCPLSPSFALSRLLSPSLALSLALSRPLSHPLSPSLALPTPTSRLSSDLLAAIAWLDSSSLSSRTLTALQPSAQQVRWCSPASLPDCSRPARWSRCSRSCGRFCRTRKRYCRTRKATLPDWRLWRRQSMHSEGRNDPS